MITNRDFRGGLDFFIIKSWKITYSLKGDFSNDHEKVFDFCLCRADRPFHAGGIQPVDPIRQSNYDTIFLGYPPWWREAPSIVWNLVENTNLSGKTIFPFCTSTSDGIEGSVETLKEMAPAAQRQEGRRFGENLNEAAVTEWVNGLAVNQ